MVHARICARCRKILNREEILKEIPKSIRNNGPMELETDKVTIDICPDCLENFCNMISETLKS